MSEASTRYTTASTSCEYVAHNLRAAEAMGEGEGACVVGLDGTELTHPEKRTDAAKERSPYGAPPHLLRVRQDRVL
jgi:hypothetical protein